MAGMFLSDDANVSVPQARDQLSVIIDRAISEHNPVYLTRHNRRVAAVIDAEDLDRVLELAKGMADIRAAEEARAETAHWMVENLGGRLAAGLRTLRP